PELIVGAGIARPRGAIDAIVGRPLFECGSFLLSEAFLVGKFVRPLQRRQRSEIPDALKIRTSVGRPRRDIWFSGGCGTCGRRWWRALRAQRRNDSDQSGRDSRQDSGLNRSSV